MRSSGQLRNLDPRKEQEQRKKSPDLLDAQSDRFLVDPHLGDHYLASLVQLHASRHSWLVSSGCAAVLVAEVDDLDVNGDIVLRLSSSTAHEAMKEVMTAAVSGRLY